MTYRSIWHGDGGRHVLLRSSLTLDGPCRDGRLTCASSGPFQLYINGMRVAGAPGGAATETPLWYPRHVSGAWDAGPHELVVVADGGPDEGERWFAVHGELTASASGTTAFTVESGLHWHALELPPAPTGTLADERFSALEDPRTEGRTWEGVVTVDATADDEVPVSQERQIEAREFAAFEETEADADLTFSPARVSRHGKFVHRDGLLAGPAPAASLQTAAGGAFTFVLDFGRIVTGVVNLRLRDGHAGIVDIGLATTWGRHEHRLRYVCGSGRQDWFSLHTVRARYAVVHLSGFDDECQFERLAICERSVPVDASAVAELGPGFDSTWAQAPATLRADRLDTYHLTPPPQACDWLGMTASTWNDAARTGHTDTARATLLGRTPDPAGAPASAFPLCLEAYHLWSGDEETAQRLLAAAVASATASLDLQGSTQGLAECAAGAAAAARICRRSGRSEEAGRCAERLQELVAAIETRWREDRALYVDDVEGEVASQFTQALVLVADAVPADRLPRMAAALRSGTPVADLRQAYFLAHGLWGAGQDRRALDVVKNQWLRIADREGLTWRDKRGSEAGLLAPGPDYLLTRWLLGVVPLEPGFRRTTFRPSFHLLPQAQGEMVTPAGPIRVSWRAEDPDEDGRTTITLETEGDGVTDLVVNRGDRRHPTLSVNGEAVWRNEKIYPNPSVQEIAADEDAVILVFDRPGTWSVTLE